MFVVSERKIANWFLFQMVSSLACFGQLPKGCKSDFSLKLKISALGILCNTYKDSGEDNFTVWWTQTVCELTIYLQHICPWKQILKFDALSLFCLVLKFYSWSEACGLKHPGIVGPKLSSCSLTEFRPARDSPKSI